MKYYYPVLFGLFLFLFTSDVIAQRNSAWEQVNTKVKERNSFKRMEWFYRQRAFPGDSIPHFKYNSIKQEEIEKSKLLRLQKKQENIINWTPVGPVGINSSFPSQWGTLSGRIRAIAVHPTNPDIVYAGAAAGGIWKSTDGGESWADIGENMENLTFGAIALDPDNPEIVYVGSGESILYFNLTNYNGNGMFKSTNGGASWTHISAPFGNRTQFSSIKVSPHNSNIVFATIGSGYWLLGEPLNEGVWRSTDAGESWTRTLSKNDAFDVMPHPTDSNLVYAAVGGANYSYSDPGFFRSTDGGVNWTKITTGLPLSSTIGRMHLALSPSSPNTIYSLIYRSSTGTTEVYKTTDGGNNWGRISSSSNLGGSYDGANWSDQGWYDLCIAVSPNDSNKVFVGNMELHRTVNGSNFSVVRSVNGPYGGISAWDSPMHVDYHQIVFAPSNPNIIYAGSDGGVFKSTNGGTTWFHRNNGLSTIQLYRVAGSPTSPDVIFGGAQDNGLFMTTNGGSGNWDLVSTGDGMELFFHPTNPDIIYSSTQNGALYRTTNGFNSIDYISPNFSEDVGWTAPFFMHPTDPATLYFATNRLYRSTNSGSTWIPLTAAAITSTINTASQSPVNPDNLILAGGEYDTTPDVFVSTDGGFNWTSVTANIPVPQKYISRVLFHPTEAQTVYVVRSGFGSGKIYKSTNMGAVWTNISGDLPDIPHNDLFVDPENLTHLYAANDLGVYLSTNGGINWERQGNNMPFVPVMDFDYVKIGNDRLLRVGTHGRSVYQANLSEVVPVELVSFTAAQTNNRVKLQWSTATETNNLGFEIERSLAGREKNYKKIGFVDGNGTTSEKKSYTFEDMPGSGKYLYRLKQVDLDGSFEYSGAVEIDFNAIVSFNLEQNYPNPFNPTTRIKYALPEEGFVKLTIYNMLGEKLADLVNEKKSAGSYEALWSPSDLASGLYLYSLEVNTSGNTYKQSKKMIYNK